MTVLDSPRRFFAVSGLWLASGIAAYSQGAPGWKIEKSGNGNDIVRHHSGASVETASVVVDKYTDDAVFARFAANYVKVCPNMASIKPQKSPNGRGVMMLVTGPTVQCVIVTGHGNNKQAFSFGSQSATHDVGMIKLAEFMTFNRIDNNSTVSTSSQQPAPVMALRPGIGKSAATSPVPTSLKAALDAVPRANRPIGMAFRSEWDSVAMSMSYFPWLLFGNNMALEADCPSWNPVVSLSAGKPRGCDTAKWTKTGSNIRFDSDDPIDTGGFFGFKPGERLAVSMGRQGGGSVSGGFATTSVLSSSELKMTAAGKIDVGSWTGTSTQGGNFVASSGQGRGLSGQYLLEGYLIAIIDSRGNISLGSIAGKIEGRDKYVFLNGKQYWN